MNLTLWAIRDVYTQTTIKTIEPLSIFRIGSLNFIAKVGGYLHDGIIIRVDVFDDINVIIIRVYIFEDVVAVRSFKIVGNSPKKTR